MKGFSVDHLSSVQFEEFCYELLLRLGAKDINWRKGTGLNSSPSDQGRDIECYFINDDPDGSQKRERWFVECKHYKEGVPPTKVEAGLSWARAERPDVFLIVASNALSNPCKEFLRRYQETERPPFRIKYWELKELEQFTVSKPDLLRKFGMTDDFPFLQFLHPAHVTFLRHPPLNTLDYFFEILEKAGPHRFREALGAVSLMVIKPHVKFPTDPNETLRDLIQGSTGYVDFRKKCYELARVVEERFLVRAIVNEALCSAFGAADKTDLDRVLKNNAGLINHLELEKKANPQEAEDLSRQIETIKAMMAEIPNRKETSYKLYADFCNEVVAPLFDQRIPDPPEVIAFMEKFIGKKPKPSQERT